MHGDDGRRFVNDTWGGKDFTIEFVEGETLGIGMEFSAPVAGAGAVKGRSMTLLLLAFPKICSPLANLLLAC